MSHRPMAAPVSLAIGDRPGSLVDTGSFRGAQEDDMEYS